MTHHTWHNHIPSWLLITVTVFVAVFFLVAAGFSIMRYGYKDRIYPGVRVAGIDMSGKTAEQAKNSIERKIAALEEGIPVHYESTQVMIAPRTISLNADLDQQFILFDADATVHNALTIGRGENWAGNIAEEIAARLGRYSLDIAAATDRVALTEALKQTFSNLERPAQNADVALSAHNQATVTPEKSGLSFEYEKTAEKVLNQFRRADRTPIQLIARTEEPAISAHSVASLQSDVDALLNLKPAELRYESKKWTVNKNQYKDWIGLGMSDGRVRVVLVPEKIKAYLEKEIAPDINRSVVEAKLTIESGRVTVWQAGKDGLAIDLDETAKRIAALSADPEEGADIAVTTVASSVPDQNAADLGLKEIIGTGVSNFSGSPANRRHNIRVGAMALHGLLIKPGEEFSLLKALGEIDAKAGYLPELVIKGNKTVPEYGGGLCQIGTTAFRATFNSGLPVTARRNHSYRVVYYEPAGTDATIYDPAPDYKFLNDTGHYILIQARIGQNELAFDFWGTSDGREINYTKPVIYNIVQPAPTKIIETTDLPEGQKKCTEKAHAGADAYFDYSVKYPDGETKQQRFTSHYIPWQAVCLVGAKKGAPASGIPGTPTSTVTPSAAPATN